MADFNLEIKICPWACLRATKLIDSPTCMGDLRPRGSSMILSRPLRRLPLQATESRRDAYYV